MTLKPKIRNILVALIVLLISYSICYLMLKGAGAPRSFVPTLIFVFLITLTISSKKVFWWFTFPFCLIAAVYTPIGFTYGELTYNFLISAIATDSLEASEFIHQIPYTNYLLPLIILGGLLINRKLVITYNIHYIKNRTFIFIAILIFVIGQAPTHFIRALVNGTQKFYSELTELKTSLEEPSWGKTWLEDSYFDTYVLIIGESARRDYHHAYGYPINNTPFMSRAPGILIDGLTAGGRATVESLTNMLTFSTEKNWEANYSKNIVDLANMAKIKTYWLSNQGYFGFFDTPISKIATRSNVPFFLKLGSYESLNTSDFLLLEKFQQIINNDSNQKKLIILHLYGSHPDACDRVEDYPLLISVENPYFNYLNCYVTSIRKTDEFIENIFNLLESNYLRKKESFSLLYFADHGLAHREINNQLYFNNNKLSKFHYDIPLFMTDSTITARKKCNSFKSGLNFTNGLANWLGIKNNNLDSNYSLFDCQDDPDDFDLSHILENINPDPAIDLSDK